MIHVLCAKFGNISLQPLDQSGLEQLRLWRNDKIISRYLSRIDQISEEQQKVWYQKYLSQNDTYIWTILEDDKTIGSLSVYNILGDTAEIGRLMIGDCSARGKGNGYKAILMGLKIGFDVLSINTFGLSVHENNYPALKTYQRAGFEKVGEHEFYNDGYEYEMVLQKEMFIEKNPISNNVLLFKRGN